jgi:hypothetical protein
MENGKRVEKANIDHSFEVFFYKKRCRLMASQKIMCGEEK